MDFSFYILSGERRLHNNLYRQYAIADVPDAETATDDLRIICGKVMKFLLTYRGTDPYDPDYGGIALHRTHISESLLPEIRSELMDDIDRCQKYLCAAETERNAVEGQYAHENIRSISLAALDYDREAAADRIEVHILIVTDRNNTAVIEVTS